MFVLTTPPTSTVEIRTPRIIRVELRSGPETLTLKSINNSVDLSK